VPVLLLFAATAYRDVTYWDVGEMDTVPWILGIAHPPGFPAYVMIGSVFSHVFALGSVAFRMSLLSAISVSVAAWCVYRIVTDTSGDRVAGVLSAWTFAAGPIVWSRATRAEVHALEIAFIAATLVVGLRWYREGRARDLFFSAAFFGCAIAVHPVALVALPGMLVLVIHRLHEASLRHIVYAAAIAALCAIGWFAYLPLRSAYVSAHALDPVAALGMPGGAFWNYDRPSSPDGFLALISARDIDIHGAAAPGEPAASALQFAREFGFAGLALVAGGWILMFRRDRWQAVALLAIACGGPLFAFGFHDESDRERYLLTACLIGACTAGIALAWLRARGFGIRVASSAATLLLVVTLIWHGRVLFGQPHDERARDQVTEILARTPDDAIVISTWVLAPPLAYAAYVEHSAGHRTIVPAWYGDTADVLARWMRERPVYVVGTPEGSVPGFRLEPLATYTGLLRVVHE
jgi:hypothetical protein